MILGVLYFAAFTHACIIAAALIRRSGGGAPTTILAALIGVFGYALFHTAALNLGFFREIPHALALVPMVAVYIGPLLFGYARRATGETPWPTWVWVVQFLPAAGFWIANAPFIFQPAAAKIAYWEAAAANQTQQLPIVTIATFLLVKAHLTAYLAISWRRLKGYQFRLDDLRADDSRTTLAQLSILISALAALEALWVVLFILQQFFGVGVLNQVNEAWLLFMAAIVLSLGYLGLRHPYFLVTPEEQSIAFQPPAPQNASDSVKYLHSALPNTAADEIAELVEKALSEKKLYLSERLTLQNLAEAVDVKPHLLSQVINQRMQTSFYRLVNGYRVQHAASLLGDADTNWPIERIAIESGFSNRVTFNKAFKAHLGSTASEYRKKHRTTPRASFLA